MSKKRILPPRLQKGQKIGVIAPADPVHGVLPKEQIDKAYSYLKERGFDVVEGKSMGILSHHTAGTVEDRISDIHDFVRREDIGCIMAFWGGFNTNQILDSLDYELIANNPKIFIGFSDITALTIAITEKTGLITFSGPGVISFAKPDPFQYTWDQFEKMCIDPEEMIEVPQSDTFADDLYFLREDSDHRIIQNNEGIKIFKGGLATSEVVAGNLQTLLVLLGTSYFPDMKGKILFIEEDETATPALVDRFLTHCKQLGIFDVISGVAFGRFMTASGFSMEDPFETLLVQYFSNVTYPVIYNADFGHTDPLFTIPHGGEVTIDAEKESRITFRRAVE